MDKFSLSRDKIKAGLHRAALDREKSEFKTRLIFSPQKITRYNFWAVCKAYAQIGRNDFKTVVIVESSPGEAEKKLVMPSFRKIETHLGSIQTNEQLRNDFADEDDDFFINDDAFDESVTLFQQLPILQCVLEDFSVLHIQITDERLPILKELAMAIQEILPSRNALLVVCCDLTDHDEIVQIQDLLEDEKFSGLMNKINREDSSIDGAGSFITGLLVAKKWGLSVHFETDTETNRVQSGYAVVQNQPIFR